MRNLKKFLALVLAMMMVMGLMVTANAADVDVSDVTEEYQEAAAVLTALDVFKGDAGGFRASSNITRAEFATVLYRLYTGDVNGKSVELSYYADKNNDSFSDVRGTTYSWATKYINYMADYGKLKGVGGGKFNPGGNVTGYEVLTALVRLCGGTVSGSGWKLSALKQAIAMEIVDETTADVSFGAAASRELVAKLAFETILYSPEGTVRVYTVNGKTFDNAADAYFYNESLAGNLKGISVEDTHPGSLAETKFSNLRKVEGGGIDEFGRPTNKWTNDKGVSVSAVNEDAITFDTKKAKGEAIAELKEMGITKYATDAVHYQNGATNSGNCAIIGTGSATVAGAKPAGSGNSDPTLMDLWTSADNTVVEIYVNARNEITTVVTYWICVNVLGSSTGSFAASSTVTTTSGSEKITLPVDQVGTPGTADWAKDNWGDETFKAGDVVLYTYGTNPDTRTGAANTWTPVIMSATHADTITGKLESITTKNGVSTYTIDGTGYTASGAVGGDAGLTTTGLVGKDVTAYLGPNNGIVKIELKKSDDTEEEVETGWIYITANATSVKVEGDKSDSAILDGDDGYLTTRIYGVLDTADKADFYTFTTSSNITTPNGLKGKLYNYTVEDGEMVLGDEVTTIAKAANQTISVGAQSIMYNNTVNATLNSDTVFLFVEVNGTKDTTIDKVTVVKGSRNIGAAITISSGSPNVYVCAENGIAKAVYVLSVPAGAADSDDYVLIDINASTKDETSTGTTHTYTGYKNDGTTTEVVVTGATGLTNDASYQYADGNKKWQVYKLKKDGTLNTTVVNSNILYGAVIEMARGSLMNFKGVSGGIDCDGVTPVKMDKNDTELKLGQTVIAIHNGQSNKGLVAAWIMKDQPATVTVTPATDVKPDGSSYTVSITPVSSTFVSSTGDGGAQVVKNIFNVTVKTSTAVQRDETVTVKYKLADSKDSTNDAVEHTTEVTIKNGATSGSKQIWIASQGDLTITIVSATKKQ